MSTKRAFVLSTLVLAAGCVRPRVNTIPSSKLEVLVTAWPRIQYIQPFQPAVYVKVTVRVRDPGRVLGCHATAWDWGDGSLAAHQADCSPDEEADPPALYVPLPRWHRYLAAGEYVIQVDVCKNLSDDTQDRKCKDTIAFGQCRVLVKDGSEDIDAFDPI